MKIKKKKIRITSQHIIQLLCADDIAYCKAENGYTRLYLTDAREFVACKSLSEICRELDSPEFLRLSQSYLVNANYIISIHRKDKYVELEDQLQIPFNIKVKELLKLMNF